MKINTFNKVFFFEVNNIMKIIKLTDKPRNIILKDNRNNEYYRTSRLTTKKSMFANTYSLAKLDTVLKVIDDNMDIVLLPFFNYNDYSTKEQILNRKPLLEITTSKENLTKDLNKYI